MPRVCMTLNVIFFLNFLDEFEQEVASFMAKKSDSIGHTLWECIDCGYGSKFKYNVTEHVRVKHLNLISAHVCEFCQITCPTKSALRSHIWRKHKE